MQCDHCEHIYWDQIGEPLLQGQGLPIQGGEWGASGGRVAGKWLASGWRMGARGWREGQMGQVGQGDQRGEWVRGARGVRGVRGVRGARGLVTLMLGSDRGASSPRSGSSGALTATLMLSLVGFLCLVLQGYIIRALVISRW